MGWEKQFNLFILYHVWIEYISRIIKSKNSKINKYSDIVTNADIDQLDVTILLNSYYNVNYISK